MVLKLRNRIRNFLKNVRGAILVEFAVCVPILILLILGLSDIFKMARMHDRTNLVAHEVAQMIQNISQGRESKKITKEDLERIAHFANYSIYPGMTLYATANRQHVYGHFPHTMIYYVVGENDGKASCKWRAEIHTGYTLNNNFSRTGVNNNQHGESIINYRTNVEPSSIYPQLTISKGEVKIIVEEFIFFAEGTDTIPNISVNESVSLKRALGLYLLTPPRKNNGYFHSVTIFTPKRGLFDESGPTNEPVPVVVEPPIELGPS